jgi:hypothetical protein
VAGGGKERKTPHHPTCLALSQQSQTWGPICGFQICGHKIETCIYSPPWGWGLLSPCNCLLKQPPPVVYSYWNEPLCSATSNCWIILRESTSCPTRCRELVVGWLDFVGVVNASSHGVGGIIMGKLLECPPMVFRFQWPPDITANVKSESNPRSQTWT